MEFERKRERVLNENLTMARAEITGNNRISRTNCVMTKLQILSFKLLLWHKAAIYERKTHKFWAQNEWQFWFFARENDCKNLWRMFCGKSILFFFSKKTDEIHFRTWSACLARLRFAKLFVPRLKHLLSKGCQMVKKQFDQAKYQSKCNKKNLKIFVFHVSYIFRTWNLLLLLLVLEKDFRG